MAEIIPAVLPKSFEDLEDKLGIARQFAKMVQIDICDGLFVPTKSWPLDDNGNFENIAQGENGLPFWQDLDFEFHLMVRNPLREISTWINAGASRILVHVEAMESLDEILKEAAGRVEIGLAFDLKTPEKYLEPYAENVDFVQFMSILGIGRQGEEFRPEVLEKIKWCKATYPELPISVDGGVNADTINGLVSAGADRLVVGSAIFAAEEPKAAFLELSDMARNK